MPFVNINATHSWRLPDSFMASAERLHLTPRKQAVKLLTEELPRIVAHAVNSVDNELFSDFEFLEPEHVIVQLGDMSVRTVNGPDVQIVVKPAEHHKLEGLFKDNRRMEIRTLIQEEICTLIKEHPGPEFPDIDLEVLPLACSGCRIEPNGSVERSWDSTCRILR